MVRNDYFFREILDATAQDVEKKLFKIHKVYHTERKSSIISKICMIFRIGTSGYKWIISYEKINRKYTIFDINNDFSFLVSGLCFNNLTNNNLLMAKWMLFLVDFFNNVSLYNII